MGLRKCCVVGCYSTHETHRLFNFSQNDKVRDLWLSFLLPVNAHLSGLSKSQLRNRFVCHKHFDRHQFDNLGNRLAHGYPCLFSAMEMKHGIPLTSFSNNHITDHNYTLSVLKECDDVFNHKLVNDEHFIEPSDEISASSSPPTDVDSTTPSVFSQCPAIDRKEYNKWTLPVFTLRKDVITTVNFGQVVEQMEIVPNESIIVTLRN